MTHQCLDESSIITGKLIMDPEASVTMLSVV
jgi:hypothetical protein